MTPDQLSVETAPGDGYAVVRVAGEVDALTAPELRDALLDAMRQHGPTILLDLADVTFMDSTGIGVLVGSERRTLLEGGRLVICRPSPQVIRPLNVLGVGRFLEIHPGSPSPDLLAAGSGAAAHGDLALGSGSSASTSAATESSRSG